MFEALSKLPEDPILGLAIAYNNDKNPAKIDLGAGVYKDEKGITPIFEAVKRAEALKLEQEQTKAYTGIQGDPVFCEKIQSLILGEENQILKDQRTCAIASPGGSGALRVAAEVINSWCPGANLWVSKPSWPNHIPLLGTAGLTMDEYPYYDPKTHSVQHEAMLDSIAKLGKQDILLLHACCHNPTGADMTIEHWKEIASLADKNGFIPFIDFAYQGLSAGIEQDAEGLSLIANTVPEIIIAYSCSKNFGLYRDRIGGLIVITESKQGADAAWSHMKNVARRLYSIPPAHGAMIVGDILSDPELKESWETELNKMCKRINDLRSLFASTMKKKGSTQDFSFTEAHNGMFSILGLSTDQVQRLKNDYSIYMANSSRVNMAGVSHENIDYLTNSILAVL